MKFYVGIPSSGRSSILNACIAQLSQQSHYIESIIVCTPRVEKDIVPFKSDFSRIVHIIAEKGSCSQRNAILDHLKNESGVVLIIDDDFLVENNYLSRAQSLIIKNPDVALINGTLIKDGISGPGLSITEAQKLLREHILAPASEVTIEEKQYAYGCNMAINLTHSRDIRFDEMLPLYGWQEDVDYSFRLRKNGRIVQVSEVSGVHLGVKIGRTSGVKLGYSQVVNPIYLVRKKTMGIRHALRIIMKNIMMNLLKSIYPEPYIDRRGRIAGNIIAIKDIVMRKLNPQRILSLD